MIIKPIIISSAFVIYCCLTAIVTIDASSIKKKRSFTDNLHSGIKLAGQIFGFESTASDVANLVAKAFSANTKPYRAIQFPNNDRGEHILLNDEPLAPGHGLLSNLLKIMGLDGGKIGALAINGILFIAQMIGRSLTESYSTKKQATVGKAPQHGDGGESFDTEEEAIESEDPDELLEPRSVDGTPLDWILDTRSSIFADTLVGVRDRNLPQRLEDIVSSLERRKGDGACIKMLLCKTAPFIRGMQRAVAEPIKRRVKNGDNDDDEHHDDDDDDEQPPLEPRSEDSGENSTIQAVSNRVKAFFQYLPKVNEFQRNGNGCEIRFNECNYMGID